MDAPLVTVVTIFRNAPSGFFAEAVASVLAQTEPRWELLLVDDGSTDDSRATAERLAAQDPARIRVLTHPDGGHHGMSATRNVGLRAARGEFVAFLDADDVYLPQKLERQVAVLRAHPGAAMAFGPTVHWWGWTGDPVDAARDSARRLGVPPESYVPAPTLVRAFLAREADTPATCGVLLRRSAVEEVGGFDPSFAGLYEDQAFFHKLLLRYDAYAEGTAWDRYRRHPEAWCEVQIRAGAHTDDYRASAARGAFLAWVESWFEENDVRDPDLLALLRRERAPYLHPVRHRASTVGRGASRRVARAVLPAAVRRAASRRLR